MSLGTPFSLIKYVSLESLKTNSLNNLTHDVTQISACFVSQILQLLKGYIGDIGMRSLGSPKSEKLQMSELDQGESQMPGTR